MSTEKKNGLLAKLFTRKPSRCCAVQIEEIPIDEPVINKDVKCCAEGAPETAGVTCCAQPADKPEPQEKVIPKEAEATEVSCCCSEQKNDDE